MHDTAHLSGGIAPFGTITFSLYGPDDPTCSRPPVFTDDRRGQRQRRLSLRAVHRAVGGHLPLGRHLLRRRDEHRRRDRLRATRPRRPSSARAHRPPATPAWGRTSRRRRTRTSASPSRRARSSRDDRPGPPSLDRPSRGAWLPAAGGVAPASRGAASRGVAAPAGADVPAAGAAQMLTGAAGPSVMMNALPRCNATRGCSPAGVSVGRSPNVSRAHAGGATTSRSASWSSSSRASRCSWLSRRSSASRSSRAAGRPPVAAVRRSRWLSSAAS